MIIAFSGSSGSGKSTLIQKVSQFSCFKDKKILVKQEDNFAMINFLKVLVGEKSFSDYNRKKLLRGKEQTITSKLFLILVYLLYPIVVYLEFVYEYVYYEIVFKDKLLLRDRYIYDYLITFEHNLKIANRASKYLFESFPKPYLLFVVNIDASFALKRNKNKIEGAITNQKSFHERVIKSYLKLASRKNLLVIDNNKSLKKSINNLKKHILNKDKFLRLEKVAICGLDGAGKTTLTKGLSKYLHKLNIACKIAHFYHDPIIFKGARKVGMLKNQDSDQIQYARSRQRSIRVKQKGKSFVWALMHYFDSYAQYLFLNTFYKGNILIFDRFFYDFFVSFEYLNITGRRLFERLVPKVDKVFLLTDDPKSVYERKPENIFEFFELSHKAYLKLAKKYEMVVINTKKKSKEMVLEEFIDLIN